MFKYTKKTFIYILNAAIMLTIIATIFFLLYLFPKNLRVDYQRLSDEVYDTVFLSMYPIDNYAEDTYTYWRGMDTIVTTHEFADLFTLKRYLHKITDSGNPVTTIYLGVLPEKLDATELTALLLSYPHIRFEVILPYPSLDYWLSLSEKQCDRLLQSYRDFIPPLLNHGTISPYFFGGAEWLIANPMNYADSFLATAEASELLMLHSDQNHNYVLTAATQPSPTASIDTLAALIAEARMNPANYPDLSDWNIVFFGDSVIGNYTNTTSIPNAVGGITGATVYNMGHGGGHITESGENYSLPDIVSAFIQKDLSLLPEDNQVSIGMESYFQDAPDGQLCFVINYGLNDYFSGVPISSEDPYDIYTFTGAARSSLKRLQEAYPDAHILINTPNFTTYFKNGTEPHYESYVMIDYINILKDIASEMNVELLDIYFDSGINANNIYSFSTDGCHPNESGRFLISQKIALKLADF